MRFFVLTLFSLFFIVRHATATHNRSGVLTYEYIGNNTFRVTVITYTEPASVTADRCNLEVRWGDGQIDTVERVNGGPIPNCLYGGEVLPDQLGQFAKRNIYVGQHTYSGFGVYKISMQDLNRVEQVLNINGSQSVEIPFYIEDSLFFLDPTASGPINNSPVINNDPIKLAFKNQVFTYNPIATDIDGDSLAYEFYTPLQDAGFPVPGFQNPDSLTIAPRPPDNFLTLDPVTGDLVWSVPYYLGVVNIGIKITEYRVRYEGTERHVIEMGNVKIDFEIIILECAGHQPLIANIGDTCVIAGNNLNIPVNITDIDPGDNVTAVAAGNPYIQTESPASPLVIASSGVGAWSGILQWQTVCNHIQPDYYQFTINANDAYSCGPLTDSKTFRVRVIGPPPENLTAVATGSTVNLSWQNPYTCSGATRFMGFSVWRRQGSNPFAIDTCTPGLAGQGYMKIASGLTDYTYTDNDVVIGIEYCYRVLAEFGTSTSLGYVLDFVESLPSNEACVYLEKDLPVITNVSVRSTDASNGSMFIAWTNPNPHDLDTLQHAGPYIYKLYRSQGFDVTPSTQQLIFTDTSLTFAGLTDTTYFDTLNTPPLNTSGHPYSYFISFIAGDDNDSLGQTSDASSVYLSLNPSSQKINLSWEEHVPWLNTSYVIYRKVPGAATFDSLITVSASPYTDKNLIDDSTYCYRIKSIGSYTDTTLGFLNPIINWSEEICAIPRDTVGPCPPTLTISNACTDVNFTLGDFVNLLNWSLPDDECAADALEYYIYYSAKQTDPLQLIDSLHFVSDTTFQHQLDNTLAGCYAISAVDSTYNIGALSNIICIDNCPLYKLPNTFTPNGDGHNDFFIPLLPYRYIQKVNMKIFTSWGSLVYETSQPALGWDGVNQTNKKQAPEGTYYYTCEVFEQRLDSTGKADYVLSGFIHLYR